MADTKWKKGQSGNLSGRPKALGAVQALARRHTVECINGLIDLARDKEQPGHVRATCYKLILDRAWGAATQPVDLKADGSVTVEIAHFHYDDDEKGGA